MTTYALPKDFAAYREGETLTDVPLWEARSWECNRCGDCCSGLRPGVKKDPATGLPLAVWGSNAPADLYASRYGGERMINPIVLGDGGPVEGDEWELDADGNPYTAYTCRFLTEHHDGDGEGPATTCQLYDKRFDPDDLSTIPPRNCGTFPIWGLEVDDAILDGKPYVPHTGAYPQCTWYGIRIVGPWKRGWVWKERWDRQQLGQPVVDLHIPQSFIDSLLSKKRRGVVGDAAFAADE